MINDGNGIVYLLDHIIHHISSFIDTTFSVENSLPSWWSHIAGNPIASELRDRSFGQTDKWF